MSTEAGTPALRGHDGLTELGWDAAWEAALATTPDPTLTPGRISRIDRGAMTVLTADGPRRVRATPGVQNAVGDWVTIADGELPLVSATLPRRSAFRRSTDGAKAVEQVIAANIDTLVVVTAVDGHLSARHLERYLVLAWRSGAVPVVAVTKADMATPDELDATLRDIRSVAVGVAVLVTSATTGSGVDALIPYLSRGRTVAFLGLSGAGKSTLTNTLAHADLLATGSVRSDGQGRHTTTHRELIQLPGGGLVIDAPGMRALSLQGASDGVRRMFPDVEELAALCDHQECTHVGERGCVVIAAVGDGRVSAERVARWLDLRDQPQPPDHKAARLEVTARKQRKATARSTRRAGRGETVSPQRAAAGIAIAAEGSSDPPS
jgi:ribosome biogenesis GTPase